MPASLVSNEYLQALVCGNLHGSFQKRSVAQQLPLPATLAAKRRALSPTAYAQTAYGTTQCSAAGYWPLRALRLKSVVVLLRCCR